MRMYVCMKQRVVYHRCKALFMPNFTGKPLIAGLMRSRLNAVKCRLKHVFHGTGNKTRRVLIPNEME